MTENKNPASGQTIQLPDPPQGSGGQAGQDDGLFAKFDIPVTVREKYSDLIPLILQTESMNDDERQYWFQILPIMTDQQVAKLREILVNEKTQLEELDEKYNQEVEKINQKHVAEWKVFESKEKRRKLKEQEGKHEQEEAAREEDLLKKIEEERV